jgi:hypothetical protein
MDSGTRTQLLQLRDDMRDGLISPTDYEQFKAALIEVAEYIVAPTGA